MSAFMCVYSNSFINFLNHAGNEEPSDNAMINTPETKCCGAAISGWEGKNWGLLFSKGHVHRTNCKWIYTGVCYSPLSFNDVG